MQTVSVLGCHFFEGVVMKRANSIDPVLMRSATEECTRWVTHGASSVNRRRSHRLWIGWSGVSEALDRDWHRAPEY